MNKNKITVIYGTAKLANSHTVEVTDGDGKATTHQAKYIILATGASARKLPNLPIDGKNIMGYRDALVLDTPPKHIVIIGAGAIGVEFAYFYNSIGAKVTILEYASHIVQQEDADIAAVLTKSFTKQGITIHNQAALKDVAIQKNQITVNFTQNNETKSITCDKVLSAVGITPNISNLGLENLGIATQNGRISVNAMYQTNIPHIYAIGDIVPGPALAHVASAAGIIAAEHMTDHNPHPLNYNNIPGCTYCEPSIASVGYTQKAAEEKGYQLRIGKFPFSASGKATAMGYTDGLIKVIFDDKTGEWLGAHMIGHGVTELISEVVVARNLETTGHEIIKSVHPHPTLSEALMEAVADAYNECIHL